MYPEVTVYIVNHNYGRFIEDSIKSVLGQTFKDLELIIIDNGSNDNSKEIIKKYSKNRSIKIIFQKNIGLNATNNVALNYSRGKFIMRLDADDYLDENALEIMYNKIKSDDKLGLVFPDYYLVDEKNDLIELVRRHDFTKVKLFDQPAHGACTLIKKEILTLLNGYNELYKCQDGWDIWLRLIKNYKVVNVNLPLFYYRRHGKNLTNKEKKLFKTRAKIFQNQLVKKKLKKCFAIIPVRGTEIDSTSYQLKNLGKKKLLDWTIDEALDARRIEKVVVTTPDMKIIKHIKEKYGKEVITFSRDFRLALHNTSLDETFSNLFNNFPKKLNNFDSLAVLYSDYPFRGSKYIDMAINSMEIFETNKVIGVRKQNTTVYRHSGKSILPLNKQGSIRLEKNEIYNEAGGIFIIRRGTNFTDNNEERVGHIDLDEISSWQIDSRLSWNLAKSIVKQKLNE